MFACQAPRGSAWMRLGSTSRHSITTEAAPAVAPVSQHSNEVVELIRSRHALQRHLPALQFRLAGTTFEGRQEAVSQLDKHQPLLLLREPSNQYDPHAVAVRTLQGVMLGYVPREHNQEFTQAGAFPAAVVSVGQAQTPEGPGPYGAMLRASPRLMPLLPLPLPSSYQGSPAQQQVQQMCGAAAEGQVCHMTWVAGSEQQPVAQAPLWVMDPDTREVRLLKLATLQRPLAQALQLLSMHPPDPERQQAELLMREFNGWKEVEVAMYVAWAKAMQQQMDDEGWSVKI